MIQATPPAPTKARRLGQASLFVKLGLMVLIIVSLNFAYAGIFSSDGGKQLAAFKRSKEKIENDFEQGSTVEWSQTDNVGTEDTGFIVSFFALVFSLTSSILQCVLLFQYKTPNNTSKVIVFIDVFLCFLGLVASLVGAGMLIHGSGNHCNEQERVKLHVTTTEGSQGRTTTESTRPRETTTSSGTKPDRMMFFGVRLDKKLFGKGVDFFNLQPRGLKNAPKEDTLKWNVKITFYIDGENTRRANRSDSFVLKYRNKCNERWGTGKRITAGAIGIFASLGFIGAGVLSLIKGLSKTPKPQTATQFQPGVFLPNGQAVEPQPQGTPSYAAASPPPPYQQGYQPQPGGPQATPSYVAAHPSQYQFQGGYQEQGGPQGNPAYGPAQPQQGYPPQGPPPQQGYQPQGGQYQGGYQNQGGVPGGGQYYKY